MLDVRTKIGAGGRVIIPSAIRNQLHLSIGDEVVLHVKEQQLCILTSDQALSIMRKKLKEQGKNKHALVDDLLDMRKHEAKSE